MKRVVSSFWVLLVVSWVALLVARPVAAAWPANVKPLKFSNGLASELGDVGQGSKVNLEFAAQSDVACWPAPKNSHFSGNHVFYSVELPAYSELTITATPRDATTDVSLYAYAIGTTRYDVPPALTQAVSCEASYGSKSLKEPYNPGAAETVTLVATSNPYNAVIAVAGAQGAGKGRFKLTLSLKTAQAAPTGVIATATPIKAKAGGKVTVPGTLDTGTQIALGWAAQSSVACWPAPANDHFDGRHQVFEFDLPAYSEVSVRVIPKAPGLDLSLYAYSVGANNLALPPKLTSVVACEASYGSKSLKQRYNPGATETVKLNAIKNPYKVFVGVAGAQKLLKGAFDLEVELSAAPAAAPTGKVTAATPLTAKPNGSVTLSGKIDSGVVIPLGWAANSSVACWPATKNDQFNGKHVVYGTDLPPNSQMTITLIPKDPKLDLNLYAYQLGSEALPPNVSSVVSCEASYGTKQLSQPFNPGGSETVKLNAIKNPYKVFIGVAGAQGVTAGAFELKVDLTVAAAEPTGKVASATLVTSQPGATVKVDGKLDAGPRIALGWAAQSSVACWPATKNDQFDGAHVVYKTKLPPQSIMKIRAIPKDPQLDVNLYAFLTTTQQLPPAVTSVVSCEASYGTKSISQPFNPGATEAVSVNATTNSYDVYIGVAGAQKVEAGSFTLEIELSATAEAEPTGKITNASKIAVARGAAAKLSSKIDAGTRIALGWAAKSSVACWPATKNDQFNGNHVVFSAELPPQSDMTITLTPKAADLDLNLYAYAVGDERLPPDVPSAVSCEASYGTKNISQPFNPGLPEKVALNAIKNPYKVYIGVAGAQKILKGAFDLEVKVTPR